jgi:serine/threonine protein kinase
MTDFGLAKKIDIEMAETMCGTPEYMAPEVIDG